MNLFFYFLYNKIMKLPEVTPQLLQEYYCNLFINGEETDGQVKFKFQMFGLWITDCVVLLVECSPRECPAKAILGVFAANDDAIKIGSPPV
ncbi:unnamed protein product [Vicia faba]|uniref:Uncharacterized protein n=1 Tax=Vicia faba TaxID=3906 RepID=A0AAV1B9P1_VICFA|nr:unnamed protein product [Vicia faba]